MEYKGLSCPVCEQPFEEGEDVVVCPVCGTPHHRSCYQQNGHCVHQEEHGSFVFEEQQKKQKETEREEYGRFVGGGFRCPRCGVENPPEGIFCQVCGTPLKEDGTSSSEEQRREAYAKQMQHQNPFTTPFGGVNPNDEIDGVSAKDLAIFVGPNSHYFLPRFENMSSKTKKSIFNWNWPAFFLSGFYFLYRKMYAVGFALIAVMLLLSIPDSLLSYSEMAQMLGLENMGLQLTLSEQDTLMTLSSIFMLVKTAIRVFFAITANMLYKKHVYGKIGKIKKESATGTDYGVELTRRGGASIRAIALFFAVLLGLSLLLNMVALYLPVLMG